MNLSFFRQNVKKIYGEKNNIKLPEPVNRLPGSNNAPKNYVDKPLRKNEIIKNNDIGSKKAIKKYDAVQSKKLDTYVNDERKEGPGEAKKKLGKYGILQSFKNEIRSTLGLPLDSKLNRGNKGI